MNFEIGRKSFSWMEKVREALSSLKVYFLRFLHCLLAVLSLSICVLLPVFSSITMTLCSEVSSRFSRMKHHLFGEDFWNSRKLAALKLDIESGIEMDFSNFFLVWSETTVIRRDFLVSFLSKYDPEVDIRGRWIVLPGESTPVVDCGVIAKFSSFKRATQAVNALDFHRGCEIMTMSVCRFLEFITEAESRHPSCGSRQTLLIVQGFWVKDMQRARQMFSRFGDLKSFEFTAPSFQPYGKYPIIKAKYAYMSHACAAQLYLDGFFFRKCSNVSVEIKATKYERQVFRMIRKKIVEYLYM